MSDDRKYRQRGYQDDDRDRAPKPAIKKAPEPGAPAGTRRISQDGPKNINMPGFREVVRCSQCGNPVSPEVGFDTRCPRCGTDLHACSQCVSFDPGSRFECMDPALTARVSPKNTRNTCTLFSPRTTVERETTTPRSDDARKAFDDLFKF
jgi:hypothetical protein